MADSDIQVTAGTGPKVDTRTVGAGTDEHRQVMVIGDPSTATDVATVTAANGLKVDVTRVTGSVTIGDGTQNIAIDSVQSDAESNGVNSLHTSSRNYVFNGTTWDRNRGDITNGLDVDVTRIIPGVASNNLGKQEDQLHQDGDTGVLMLGVRNHVTGSTVDGEYSAISVSSTGEMQTLARRDLVRLQQAISFTGNPPAAYVSGDQFGNLVTLTNAARVSGGTGTITGVTINSASVLIGPFDVLFFESSVTLAGDSSPFSISDADGLKLIGIVPLAGAYSLGLNRVSQAFNLAVPYVCVGSTSLFAAIITRAPFTLAAGDFASNLNVFVERN
jgi:hypothetical protein